MARSWWPGVPDPLQMLRLFGRDFGLYKSSQQLERLLPSHSICVGGYDVGKSLLLEGQLGSYRNRAPSISGKDLIRQTGSVRAVGRDDFLVWYQPPAFSTKGVRMGISK